MEWKAALELLTAEETDRVERFVRVQDRKLALGARLLARRLVASRTGKGMKDVRIARTRVRVCVCVRA